MLIEALVVVLSTASFDARAATPAFADQAVHEQGGQDSEKATKKPKDPQKPKKKKKVKSDTPSPDEPIDPDVAEPGGGVRFVWKQHPSLRFGSVFRVDFEAKLQEDARWSYPDAAGLKDPITGTQQTFQLHPGAWKFASGHIAKLELLGQDPPYARTSNGTFSIAVNSLKLRLPTH